MYSTAIDPVQSKMFFLVGCDETSPKKYFQSPHKLDYSSITFTIMAKEDKSRKAAKVAEEEGAKKKKQKIAKKEVRNWP